MKCNTRQAILSGIGLGMPFLASAAVYTGNIGMAVMIPITVYCIWHALWAEKKIKEIMIELSGDSDEN